MFERPLKLLLMAALSRITASAGVTVGGDHTGSVDVRFVRTGVPDGADIRAFGTARLGHFDIQLVSLPTCPG